MINVIKLNKISDKVLDILKDNYKVEENIANPEAALVRSFSMHEWEVPASLLCVARAGAGVNNIPFDAYREKGIVVFNTPGANANAVKELVIASMLLAARNLVGAIKWANALTGDDVAKQVEKGKGQFVGTEIMGKTLGVLGLGAIGRKVALTALALGMKVIGFDPFLSDAAKAELKDVTIYSDMKDVIKESDFISLHMPYTKENKELINASLISEMKDGVIIINAARGELVNVSDIKAAINSGKVRSYVVDFPDANCINSDGIIAIPHLGASTEEAEDNCAIMAAEEIKEVIETGNIYNSVNFPTVKAEKRSAHRATVFANASFNSPQIVAKADSKGIVYAILESDTAFDKSALEAMDGVIRARVIY